LSHLAAFQHLLIGFDGSEGGRDALELGRVFASPTDADFLVVTVFPYGPFPIGFVALQEKAARDAEPLFAEAREVLGEDAVETQVFGGGSAAWVMNHFAEQDRADLLVVGSPHRGTLGRVLLGSVAMSLLHGSPCPVAVAPRGFATEQHDTPLRVIAVAYDGTEESNAALHRAEVLALSSGASLRLLTVVGPQQVIPGAAGYVPAVPPQPEKVLADGLAGVGPKVEAEGRRLDGPPAPTLAAACEDDVDLLVVGSRGYGPTMRVLLGSVSAELMRRAPCPVLVTHRRAE
jgi:nucleotide-binding universal stress UspA family protein